MLDAELPGRAVVLHSQDLHSGWFSPAALALVGAADHATGVLRERAWFEALGALPPIAAD